MTETSWPYTDDATTDAEYSWLMRQLSQGVTTSNGSSTLRGSADSSGMVSYCEAGRAVVQGYMYRNSSQLTLNHDAADTYPRIDVVAIELDIAAVAPNDRAKIVILKGSPSVTPVAPSLVQTDTGIYQFPLYHANIGSGATNIAPSDIIDKRTWAGHSPREWITANRPTLPAPSQLGYNTSLSRWERWDGSAWVGFDATTVGGREILDGTSNPSPSAGSENAVFLKYNA